MTRSCLDAEKHAMVFRDLSIDFASQRLCGSALKMLAQSFTAVTLIFVACQKNMPNTAR